MEKTYYIGKYRGFPVYQTGEWIGSGFYGHFTTKQTIGGRPQTLDAEYNRLEDLKAMIDGIVDKGDIVLTKRERTSLIDNPNSKADYFFSRQALRNLAKKHQAGDRRIKYALELRLTDCNFHGYAAALSKGDYDTFAELLDKEYPTAKKCRQVA